MFSFIWLCHYLRPDETWLDERRSIITGFVSGERGGLEATSSVCRWFWCWLCMDAPCHWIPLMDLVHLADFVNAGLERIKVSL